jgi:hypothetical protein
MKIEDKALRIQFNLKEMIHKLTRNIAKETTTTITAFITM